MYIGMNILLGLALALAAIGSSTRYQKDFSNSSAPVRGQNLNHNETLVRDTPQKEGADWSLWLTGERTFDVATLLTSFSFYRAGAGCSKWVCGSNHNETLVRDTTLMDRADDWRLWLSGDRSFAAAPLFIQFSFYRVGAGCPHWHCNHNETLVRERTPTA